MTTNRKLYLASSSPRRQELVRLLGLPHEVRVSAADETTAPGLAPADIVSSLALRKAFTVHRGGLPEPGVILGADTIVVADGRVLGKPKHDQEACDMLQMLQGRTHEVYSGVALVDSEWNCDSDSDAAAAVGSASFRSAAQAVGELASYRQLAADESGQARVLSGYSVSRVTFRPMSAAEIRAYAATGEPKDKAGAYAVQGIGAVFVEKLEGDFFSVMGLPLCLLYPMLQQFGFQPLA